MQQDWDQEAGDETSELDNDKSIFIALCQFVLFKRRDMFNMQDKVNISDEENNYANTITDYFSRYGALRCD